MTENNNYENMSENFDQNHDLPMDEKPSIIDLAKGKNNFADVREKLDDLIQECSKVLVGQEELIELMVACILCDGHVLLEGVPGVANLKWEMRCMQELPITALVRLRNLFL